MNKNLQGGYYIVSLGGVDILGESVSLPNIAKLLYEAKKYKFVVLQDIVMDGAEKTAIPVLFDAFMAVTTEPEDWDEETDGEFVSETIYTATIYNVYGKNIAIDAEGDATITDYMEGLDPSDLYGKFVRIIDAPTSTTLTDDLLEIFKEGVFVQGNFLNMKNPLFFPAQVAYSDPTGFQGICIGVEHRGELGHEGTALHFYEINSSKAISKRNTALFFDHNQSLLISSNLIIYEKTYPSYPTNQTDKKYHFVLNNRNLRWQEGNGLYLHTITFNVSGGSDTFVIRIVSDSATACALDSVSGNFVIAGATCLVPSNMGNAVLTPFDANGFNPDIHLFDSATGAYSTAVTLASVESDVITPIG